MAAPAGGRHAVGTDAHAAGHPAPARGQVSNAALWAGIFAAPAAWSVQTLVNYAVAAHSCYPGLYPRGTPAFGATRGVALATSVLAVAVGVVAGLFAYREWTRSRGEVGGASPRGRTAAGGPANAAPANGEPANGEPANAEPADVRAALEIGEGRTRFMAMSGILTSVTFVLASLVHGLALLLVPPCGV